MSWRGIKTQTNGQFYIKKQLVILVKDNILESLRISLRDSIQRQCSINSTEYEMGTKVRDYRIYPVSAHQLCNWCACIRALIAVWQLDRIDTEGMQRRFRIELKIVFQDSHTWLEYPLLLKYENDDLMYFFAYFLGIKRGLSAIIDHYSQTLLMHPSFNRSCVRAEQRR